MRYLIILTALVMASCQSAEDHGHAHDETGGHTSHDSEIPTVDYTVWTDKTELFVEFPAFVVGKTSRFAAHFTLLDEHQAIQEGSVTASLVRNGKGIRHEVEEPARAGIFMPSLQPKEAGVYQLVFELKTKQYSDRIVINDIQVYATAADARKALEGGEENGNAITFLKEQAWKIAFQTAPVLEKEIYQMIPTSGVWKVAPSDYQSLVSTTNGRVTFKQDNLIEGRQVRKGQVLMTISSEDLNSNNLSAEIQKARAEFEQAKAEYDRKKDLYASKIIAKAEFEQVEQKYKMTKANYETLSTGYSSGGKPVIVPFDGYIKSIVVANGGFVQQGVTLITITSQKSSLLEAQVSQSYSADLSTIHDLWYQPKAGEWSSLNQTGGKIISVGKQVESDKPLLSVFAQINEGVEMPEGGFTEVQLAVGTPSKSMVIPATALLEDYGNYWVIVQLSGESFERRNVTVSQRNGSEVAITKGLELGEVVVTKGAYQVKMASMSGQAPAHGHAH